MRWWTHSEWSTAKPSFSFLARRSSSRFRFDNDRLIFILLLACVCVCVCVCVTQQTHVRQSFRGPFGWRVRVVDWILLLFPDFLTNANDNKQKKRELFRLRALRLAAAANCVLAVAGVGRFLAIGLVGRCHWPTARYPLVSNLWFSFVFLSSLVCVCVSEIYRYGRANVLLLLRLRSSAGRICGRRKDEKTNGVNGSLECDERWSLCSPSGRTIPFVVDAVSSLPCRRLRTLHYGKRNEWPRRQSITVKQQQRRRRRRRRRQKEPNNESIHQSRRRKSAHSSPHSRRSLHWFHPQK